MPKRDAAPIGAPCWVDLFTRDTDKAQAFYGELFGWTAESAGEEFGGYINFSKDDVRVAGCMGAGPDDEAAELWTVYLATDDAQATVDRAGAGGGQVILPPQPVGDLGTMGMVVDPGGASIGLWEPKEFPGFGVFGEPGTPAWFELHTRSYDIAVDFYRDVFRWKTRVEGDEPDFRYTTYVNGEAQFAGIMDASKFPDDAPLSWSIYFGVENTDATLAKTTELGGAVVVPAEDTPYGRLAAATDPSGALFKVVQG